MERDLIDEYRFMLHPLVRRRGKRRFRDDIDEKVLELVDTKAFRTGVSVLSYRPAGAA